MKDVIKFIAGPISPEEVTKTVKSVLVNKAVGAHDFFLGQIREDKIDNKDVQAIEFSAYEEMAINQLTDIVRQAKEEYKELFQVTILHSLGKVKTGELCMLVFVATGHRDEAYKSNRFIVEAIKKDVPIFGKELFDGDEYVWKENKF